MKKSFSFLVSTICIFGTSIAQFTSPTIEWQKTIGGSQYDELRSLKRTSDGGYILGGYSASNISGDKTENSQGFEDYWVIKLDASGTIEWQNTIGGSGSDRLFDLQQTADGGYILGGNSDSGISGDKTEPNQSSKDYWVLKLDATGAIQWQKNIGGFGPEILFSVQQTTDGGYILGGTSKNSYADYFVVKLNSTGAIQWQKTISGQYDDWLISLQQTADGGYILGGYSASNIFGDKTENSQGETDYWVVKLNSTGDIQWQNTIGGNAADNLHFIQQTPDWGYILAGYSASGISGDKTEGKRGILDYWVVKLDVLGAIQWQKTIGGSGIDVPEQIQQTSDGGYIIGGNSDSGISGDKTESGHGGDDYWIVKLDALGAIQWQKTIGGSGLDRFYSLQQTADKGYILGGFSGSNISGDKTVNSHGSNDFWVLKIAPETVPTEEALNVLSGLTIYPNPAYDVLFVQTDEETTLQLQNAFGQILSSQTIQGEAKIDLARYPNGIYFLVDMETGIGHKVIKNK